MNSNFLFFIIFVWTVIGNAFCKVVIKVSPDEWLLKNRQIPDNWKTDSRYMFKWEGDFSYGLPESFPCEKVQLPKYGRFVCSDSSKENLLNNDRVMCLPECMIGYENTGRPQVYLCTRDGIWLNLHKKEIATPKFNCMRNLREEKSNSHM